MPCIMPLDKSQCMFKVPAGAVLVVLIALFVLMKDDARIIHSADIPAMTSASALNGDIIFISRKYIEIVGINQIELFSIKHLKPSELHRCNYLPKISTRIIRRIRTIAMYPKTCFFLSSSDDGLTWFFFLTGVSAEQ